MDEAVLSRLREEDPKAVAEILATVKRWCRRCGIPEDDADDVALETVEAALLEADSYRGEGDLEKWLIGIAKRRWMNLLRGRYRQKHPPESLDETELDVPDKRVDVAEMAIDGIAAREAIASLPDDERTAFLLRARDGLSSEEIAQRMGRSVDAVRALKYRATKRLGQYEEDFHS